MKLICTYFNYILPLSLGFLFSSCENLVEQDEFSLKEIATEFNKKCPRMIDQETRIEGIEIPNPTTILYKYTLVNLPSDNVDTTAFRNAVGPGIISMIKLSPEMKDLREAGTNFQYRYNDKNNKHIYTFKIYPSDYKP